MGPRAERVLHVGPGTGRTGPGADLGGVSPEPGTDVAVASPVPVQMWWG